MKPFLVRSDWIDAIIEAEKKLEEIRDAEPLYCRFIKKVIRLEKEGWKVECVIRAPGDTFSGYKNVFEETIKEWMNFSKEESEKIWTEIKGHNICCARSEKIDTKKVYETMTRFKNIKNQGDTK